MSIRVATTKEQAFCGTWYECTSVWPQQCRNAALDASPELLAHLATQKS